MTTNARRIAALAAAVALVASLPFLCPCGARRAAADGPPGAHGCCAPAAGLTAVDPDCCGGRTPSSDALAAADPSTPPPPAVAVLPAAAAVTAPARDERRLVMAPVAPSPPPVLRI
jgi:hypothetical protein